MPTRTITTSGEEILPRNRLRKSFIIQNEDELITCFVKRESPGNTTVSTTNHDHRIPRESALAINSETDGKEPIQDRWTIVAESGTPRVSFFETEDIVR